MCLHFSKKKKKIQWRDCTTVATQPRQLHCSSNLSKKQKTKKQNRGKGSTKSFDIVSILEELGDGGPRTPWGEFVNSRVAQWVYWFPVSVFFFLLKGVFRGYFRWEGAYRGPKSGNFYHF